MTWYLVIGGDGLIGKNLFEGLCSGGLITYKTSRRNVRDKLTFPFDLNNPLTLFNDIKFNKKMQDSSPVVFISASITGLANCENDPKETAKINVDSTVKIAEEFLKKGSFVIFLSSNAIFSYSKSPPDEKAEPFSTTEYGRQKISAEEILRKYVNEIRPSGKLAIVRLTKVMSKSLPIISRWKKIIESNQLIEAFNNKYVSPISVNYCVSSLVKISELQKPGIYHLSGSENITYYELAKMLVKKWGTSMKLVKEIVEQDFYEKSVTNIASLSMRCTTEITGIQPQKIEEVIEELC